MELDPHVRPQLLGSDEFRADHRIRYAYVAGAMYKGVSSPELIISMGKARLLGYLGTGGMDLGWIEAAIREIQFNLARGEAYGANLVCDLGEPQREEETARLYCEYGVSRIEAAGYPRVTRAVVLYHLKGLARMPDGTIEAGHKLLAKVSHPSVAEAFMQPPPEFLVRDLLASRLVTPEQAEFGAQLPLASDICVEADSGGHTDRRVALTIVPVILSLRDRLMKKYRYPKVVRVGCAGGIGTPQAAAAAFAMGADFILTGSINQCTVEAGLGDAAKDQLQTMTVTDTAYVPAADLFELGAQAQVLKRGLFPGRAARLYELYRRYHSFDELDDATRQDLERNYFGCSVEEAWRATRARHAPQRAVVTEELSPRAKMASVFKWYLVQASDRALRGAMAGALDYQIQSGSALGAFNNWMRGTEWESWRSRHAADIADRIMCEAAMLLTAQFRRLVR